MSIIQFPPRQPPINQFTPARIADLVWFDREAALRDFYLQTDADEATGTSGWIATNDDGGQYVTIAHRYSNGGLFIVGPEDGGWSVMTWDGRATERFGSLREALQAILSGDWDR